MLQPKIYELRLSGNSLTGTLPSSLVLLTRLKIVELANNKLTGLPPKINATSPLEILNLSNNKFEGPMSNLSSHSKTLGAIILSGNSKLTGSFNSIMGDTIFPELISIDVSKTSMYGNMSNFNFFPKLKVFVTASNCFEGSIPISICNSTSLQALILDGMASGPDCVSFIYKDRKNNYMAFNGVTSKRTMTGSIPECIFHLPALKTLHLSGLGLVGSIPNNVSTSIKQVSASYNNLYGPISQGLLKLKLVELDLSYNKIVGSIDSDSVNWDMNGFISLKNNRYLTINHFQHFLSQLLPYYLRLSGPIPESMKEFTNISVLEGNIFTCSDTSSLPENDVYLDKFSCGSNIFNEKTIIFTCIMFAVVFIYLINRWFSSQRKSMLSNVTENLRTYLSIFETPKVSPGLASFAAGLKKVRYLTMIITAMITLLIPIYSIIKTNNTLITYSYQNGWTPSAAFLSGEIVSIILIVFWLIIIAITLDKVTTIFGHHGTKFTLSGLSNVKLSIWFRFFALTFIISSFNAVIIVSANIAYGILLQIGSSSVQTIAGIVISIFKIIWNSVAINMLRRLRFTLLEEEYNACMDLIYGGDVIFFTLILIFNTIVSPIVATLLGETNCFRNALYAPETIISTYQLSVPFKYVIGPGFIDRNETYIIEFMPNFQYGYACTSFILVDYAPVFVISAVITSFLKPIKDIVYRVLNNFVTTEYNENLLRDTCEVTSLRSPKIRPLISRLQLLNRVPKLLWRNDEREFSLRSHNFFISLKAMDGKKSTGENIENLKIEEKVEDSKPLVMKILGHSVIIIFSILNAFMDIYNAIFNDIDQDDDVQVEQILDFESFTLTILTKIFIIMTFGIMCPLLAIITAISIFLQCWYLQILIGRYLSTLHESDVDNDKKIEILNILETDCDSNIFASALSQIRFVLIFFTSLFMAAFLLDISGDQLGWRNALGNSLIQIIIINFYANNNIYSLSFCNAWSNSNNNGTTLLSTTVIFVPRKDIKESLCY